MGAFSLIVVINLLNRQDMSNERSLYSGIDVKIERQSPLAFSNRGNCLNCGRSRKWFCCSCVEWTSKFTGTEAPKVILPFELHVLKHNIEISGKSTAIHAAMLLSSPCRYEVYPTMPDYRALELTSKIWVLYPGEKAQTVNQLVTEMKNTKNTHSIESWRDFCTLIYLNTLVLIDGTWSQTHCFLQDPRLQDARSIKYVQLGNKYRTNFWRPQGKLPANYLATIEALFYFAKELQNEFWSCVDPEVERNEHEFDNLLYFYDFMLKQVVGQKKSHPN